MRTERYPFAKSWNWYFVRCFDVILDRFAKRIRAQEFPRSVQNILVVRLDQIGDLVNSLPVFPVLRRRFPDAKITALVGGEGEAILSENPFVDRLIVFRSNWFRPDGWVNLQELFLVLSELRRTRFCLGFDLRGDLRNILLMTLGHVSYRIGYGIAGGGGLLHEDRVYDLSFHQAELNLRLVSAEAIRKENLKPEIYLTSAEEDCARKQLVNLGIREEDSIIAIHPEAGYSSKEWGSGQFLKLIESLLEQDYGKILILGLRRVKEIAARFSGHDRVIDLVGELSLRDMIAVLSQCHLFIGNDSGPSHLAQALGIPTIVIASGTNEYEKWGIWRKPSRVLRHEVPCSPCHLRRCNVEGHPCMSQISADDALHAVEDLFSEVS